jgi:predicted LPLAT superfamily acyltransferase
VTTALEEPSHLNPPSIRAPQYGGYIGNMFMLWAGRICLPLGYILVTFVALGIWLGNAKARNASIDYLNRIFRPRPIFIRWWQSYRHMLTFGILLLDRSVALAGKNAAFEVVVPEFKQLCDALQPDRGFLILTGHFGSPELAAPHIKDLDDSRPMNFVMYRDIQDKTEQFHSSQWKAVESVRVISSTDPLSAGVQIMAALQRHESVGIRADRAMSGRTIPVTLLGRSVGLPAGPFTAAVLSGAVVITAFNLRVGYRRYCNHTMPPRCYEFTDQVSKQAAIEQAARDYARELEKLLRRYPYQWSNFYLFWDEPAAAISSSITDAGTPAT